MALVTRYICPASKYTEHRSLLPTVCNCIKNLPNHVFPEGLLNYFPTAENFKAKFYTPIICSYLCWMKKISFTNDTIRHRHREVTYYHFALHLTNFTHLRWTWWTVWTYLVNFIQKCFRLKSAVSETLSNFKIYKLHYFIISCKYEHDVYKNSESLWKF